jgi:uncharacterized membrane protein YfcA
LDVYLPIAEIPVNVLLIVAMGAAIGFLSGMFGVGGGFLLTPLLIFAGVPSAIAVATVSSQIVASSTSGALAYMRRGTVDLRLAGFLFVSAAAGSALGVWTFGLLRSVGQLDLVIAVSYVSLLGAVGVLMISESARAIAARRRGQPQAMRRPGRRGWVDRLPLKVRFRTSRLYISAIPVLAIGLAMTTMLGVGGGFIMVPALIYLLRVPTNFVVGTTLVQTVGTMAVATTLHAVTNQTIDVLLGVLLMIGGVIGAQFGARLGVRLRGETLRALLGLIVLTVAIRFLVELVARPAELFSLALRSGAPL